MVTAVFLHKLIVAKLFQATIKVEVAVDGITKEATTKVASVAEEEVVVTIRVAASTKVVAVDTARVVAVDTTTAGWLFG